MRDPACRAIVLAVDGNEVVAGFIDDPLQSVGRFRGFAVQKLLLRLGQPLARLRRVAVEIGGFLPAGFGRTGDADRAREED